jgi:hypothetical protein
LQSRWHFDDQRTILFQVKIAERIDNIGVRRRDQRFGIEPLLGEEGVKSQRKGSSLRGRGQVSERKGEGVKSQFDTF